MISVRQDTKSPGNTVWGQIRALFLREVHHQKRQRKTLLLHLGLPILISFGLVILRITLFTALPASSCRPTTLSFPMPAPGAEKCEWQHPDTKTCSSQWTRALFTNSFEGMQAGNVSAYLSTIPRFPFSKTNDSRVPIFEGEPSFDMAVLRIHRATQQYHDNPSDQNAYGLPTGALYFQALDAECGARFVLQASDPRRAEYYPPFFQWLDERHYLLNTVSVSMLNVLGARNANMTVPEVRLTSKNAFPLVCFPGEGPQFVTAIVFLFAIPFVASFLLPVFLQGIVRETRSKLLELQKMFGLRMVVFWAVNYAFDLCVYTAIASVMLGVLAVAQVEVVVTTSWVVLMCVFMAWGHGLVSVSYFLSVFFTSPLSAGICGYVIQLLSLALAATLNATVYVDMSATPTVLYSVYPPFAFFRCVYLMVARYTLGDPLQIDDLAWGTALSREVMFLLIVSTGLLLLAMYLDAVLPKKYGVPASPLFPLLALVDVVLGCWYRQHERRLRYEDQEGWTTVGTDTDSPGTDEWLLVDALEGNDVAAERRLVHARGIGARANVVVRDLGKVYRGRWGQRTRRALRNLCLTVQDGECLALLGPNLAGKSTLINILCGLYRPSSGDALVNGMSIRTRMGGIHRLIGVCPQNDDCLWDDLSVRDHLLYFARLKGIPRSQEKMHVEDVLQQIQLKSVELQWAAAISAGMRRRLSIAIALIGNPRLLILDEPTTALDVISRRAIWDVLLRARAGRSMLLATHSMEEAEVLGTRIAIMVDGSLRCIGTRADLQTRFGSEYRLVLTVGEGKDPTSPHLEEWVQTVAPGAYLWSVFGLSVTYLVPKEAMQMSHLFTAMERQAAVHGVIDWAISLTSLEEVFFSIVREHGITVSNAPRAQATPAPASSDTSSSDTARVHGYGAI